MGGRVVRLPFLLKNGDSQLQTVCNRNFNHRVAEVCEFVNYQYAVQQ